MGFDDENLEPKPRKLNKKTSKEDPKSFLVIYGGEKRQLTAACRNELLKNVSVKFGIEDLAGFKLEFWSNVFQEWVLLDDQLPDDNSKIQVTEPTHRKESDGIEFASTLNESFKKYLESDDGSILPDFETAIIFVLKRKAVVEYLSQQQQLSGTEWAKLGARVNDVEQAVGELADEVKSLKVGARQTKTVFDKINEKLSVEADVEKNLDAKKQASKLKNSCFIC